jgi:hypothetical protein
MLPLGHMGIGLEIAMPLGRRLSKRMILLGTVLPDLIDKPVYYGLSYITGKSGAKLGIIAGTRSFGHTALFLIGLTLVAVLKKSKALAAVSLGVATHLLLDNVSDLIVDGPSTPHRSLLWPLEGEQFPIYPFHGIINHLEKGQEPFYLFCEVLGALLLFWEYWKEHNRRKILREARAQLMST